MNLVASEELIEGVINPAALRKSEDLPESADEARTIMTPWATPRFWQVTGFDLSTSFPNLAVLPCLALINALARAQQHPNPHLSTTFMLYLAIERKRPLAVLERNGSSYRNPMRIYGE